MKIKLLSFFLLSLLCACVLFATAPVTPHAAQTSDAFTVLLLGVDNAASNSDVVALARYDIAQSSLVVMQLPRDLYIEGEDDTPKLNHLFAACRASGMSAEESLAYTKRTLSSAFSIPIDAAICLDLATFSSLVDAVGGITVDVPFDMTYEDPADGLSIALKKGRTVLDGNAAAQFVRYRSGYVEGDLGRLDAQKIFFAACADQVLRRLTVTDAMSVLLQHGKQICIVGEADMLRSALRMLFSARRQLSLQLLSIPGEAVQAPSGIWYYILNRRAACEVLNLFFAPHEKLDESSFDMQGRFYSDHPSILNIYFSHGIRYRLYRAEEITDINIIKKD